MTYVNVMYIVWAVIAIAAVFIELNTTFLAGFAATLGAIGAIIVNSFDLDQKWVQFLTFISIWIVAWMIMFYFLRKYRTKLHDKSDGYMGLIGQKMNATVGNENGFGKVQFDDKVYRFKSEDKIAIGDKVEIKSIKGVTMHVTKASNKKSEATSVAKKVGN